MKLGEYLARLRGGISQMEANRAEDALNIANDLSALVRLRINTQGKDYTGASFAPYSPAYARRRQAKGRQISFVDFNDTGALQASTGAVLLETRPGVAKVGITASGPLSQAKLRGALTQPKGNPRGNILRPSEKELATVRAANQARALKYLSI